MPTNISGDNVVDKVTSTAVESVDLPAGSVGAITFNGGAGARKFGGSLASSITITEIAQ